MDTLNPHVYKPNIDEQYVIASIPEFGIWDKYTNCTVLSRTNWECTYNDDSGEFGFRNGIYWDYYTQLDTGERGVGRLDYLWTDWRAFIEGVINL